MTTSPTALPVAHGHRVSVTEHANDRAFQRYGVPFNEADAWLIDHLQRATSAQCDHEAGRIYWQCPDRATIVTTFADEDGLVHVLTVIRKRGNQWPLDRIPA